VLNMYNIVYARNPLAHHKLGFTLETCQVVRLDKINE